MRGVNPSAFILSLYSHVIFLFPLNVKNSRIPSELRSPSLCVSNLEVILQTCVLFTHISEVASGVWQHTSQSLSRI